LDLGLLLGSIPMLNLLFLLLVTLFSFIELMLTQKYIYIYIYIQSDFAQKSKY